jgi:MtN3 and saliva related transmembrane protein
VTTVDALAIGAACAGLAMAASPLLQIRRMRRTRSSRDVSLLYLSLLNVGFIIWLAYALALANPAMIVSNSASFAVMTITIVTALRFRRAGARRDAAGLAAEAEAKAARVAQRADETTPAG